MSLSGRSTAAVIFAMTSLVLLGCGTSSARSAMAPDAMAPDAMADPRAPNDPGAPVDAAGGSIAAATRTRLDQALAGRDVCEVYAALGELEVSGRSVTEFRAAMLAVLDAVRRAVDFAPAELADAWEVLVADTERVVEVLGTPDAAVSSAASVFGEPAYRDAMDEVDRWMGDHCAR